MIRSFQNSVPILVFHKIDFSFEWGVTRVTPLQFRNLLAFLKHEGYTSISLRQLCDTESVLPPKPVVLTFDDAYESVYTQAFPMLQEHGFGGTVFVISGYVGAMNTWDVNLGGRKFRHLSWTQINELKEAGFEIGSHTVHHPNLTRLGPEFLMKELEQSKAAIEDGIGEEVLFVSFPFGKVNERVIDVCRSCGYWKGCGCLLPPCWKKDYGGVVLERKTYYLFDGIVNLKSKLDGHSPWSALENMKLRMTNVCSYGTSFLKPTQFRSFS